MDARSAKAKRKIATCTAAGEGVKAYLIECFMVLRGKGARNNAPSVDAMLCKIAHHRIRL
jgi:hypothetical protein